MLHRGRSFCWLYAQGGKRGVIVTELVGRGLSSAPTKIMLAAESFKIRVQCRPTLTGTLGHLILRNRLRGVTGKGCCVPGGAVFKGLGPTSSRLMGSFLRRGNGVMNCVAKATTFTSVKLAARVDSSVLINAGGCEEPVAEGNIGVSFLLRRGTVASDGVPLLEVLSTLHLVGSVPTASPSRYIVGVYGTVGTLSGGRGRRLTRLSLTCAPCMETLLKTVCRGVRLRARVVDGALGKIADCGLPVSSGMLSGGEG